MSNQRNYKQSIKIAVVGDIHDLWEAEDAIALNQLGVDLVLFVGDFGNEAVDIVRLVADIDLPKAAIMGTMMLGTAPPTGEENAVLTIVRKKTECSNS
jgi:hypothetical protein